MSRKDLVFCVSVLILLARIDGAAAGQHDGNHTPALPVLVDGAKTPELIPDSLAFQHFIKALAIPDSPSTAQEAVREALLSRLTLSDADHRSFVTALSGVRSSLDNMAASMAKWPADSPTARAVQADMRRQEAALMDGVRNQLQTNLSADGWTRFNKYISEHVKRRIVIYGGQPH
jgi:hypothetical protein